MHYNRTHCITNLKTSMHQRVEGRDAVSHGNTARMAYVPAVLDSTARA